MKLAVFDMDGTLTRTTGIDTGCFARAFCRCFGADKIETDWSLYKHTTDAAIFQELFLHHFQRPADTQEMSGMHEAFMEELQSARQASPEQFVSIPGAPSFLRTLRAHQEWRPAIATGSWGASALFKLNVTGLSLSLPLASSDDGLSREEIVQTAIDRACSAYGTAGFDRIVSVGDGIWDVTAAAKMSLPFIGIAPPEDREKLLQAAVSHVLSDFTNEEAVLAAFENATVPAGRKTSYEN